MSNEEEDEDMDEVNMSQPLHADADFKNEKAHNSTAILTRDTVKRGDRVLIHWLDDNAYYAGTVQHFHRDGCATVNYNDGDRERLNLSDENWPIENSTMAPSTS